MLENSCSSITLWSPSQDLSERVKKLRDEYFSFNERDHFRNEVMSFTTGHPWDIVYSEHAWGVVPEVYIFMEGYKVSLLVDGKVVPTSETFWHEPKIVRRALFFKEVVENYLPVQILAGELIVGGQFNTALSRTLTKRETRKFKRAEKKYVKELKAYDGYGFGNAGATSGHLIPDYKTVLRIGFKGLKQEFESLLATAQTQEHRDLLRALIICAEVPRILAQRYAQKLTEMVQTEESEERKEELKRLAEICNKVPWEPAGNYWEALQSLWFTHMLVMAAESYPGPGLSYGRFDQYIFPYYQADLKQSELELEFARELLNCFFIKHNYAYDYQGRVGNNQGINSSFGQLITLSGMGADGEDLTNDFTYLCLDVIEELNMLEPKPNVRLHKNTPPELLRRVTEIISRAQGAPFLLNFDESSMRALEWIGFPKEKVWDYAPVGCLENTLQGNDRSGTVDVNFNLAKAVELVLYNGKDQATGKQVGPRTGDPTGFTSFEQFRQAYEVQTTAIMERLIHIYNQSDEIRARYEPTPYLSTLVRGCETSGQDVTAGGAEHNFITMEGIALATTIDSLLAVKKLVFEDKKISMSELIKALDANFEGYEVLRQMLINKAPKYGNDDPDADELAQKVSKFWSTAVTKYSSPYTGRRYRAGYLSWNYWISYAPRTAATPDGRKRGAFLSNGVCPVNGVDLKGPTAVINSVGNIDLSTIPNGASHTISLSPSLLRDTEHLAKFEALLRAYCEHGGTALQVNVLDSDTLKKAQQNPDEYRNLLVRVTGYNAYFVTLGKEIQDEIITRESHQI
ncbi:pyruvate formate lyase family protein [candidate division CSSED10-310 bacterium]|uniref:Pyruvate formate lyase family protein n=1 Tax=candidate division CSSED10-310 bacterium TaxID=2855610 RepID=A0ABV6YRB5_UNCC1